MVLSILYGKPHWLRYDGYPLSVFQVRNEKIVCSIPSVTLLEKKRNYEDILARLEKLAKYKEELTEFRAGLVPILEGIIRTFDNFDRKEVKRF